MTSAVSPLSVISRTIMEYLDEEEDLPFRHTKVQRIFSQVLSAVRGELPPWLCWRDRPDSVNKKITEVFMPIERSSRSNWGSFNGDESYKLCGIDESRLLEALIREAPPTRKEFYVLDIGAGDFQCGKQIAEFINALLGLAPDVTVHIISVRGERASAPSRVESGRCIRYNLGSVKIEELSFELQRLGLEVEGKINIALTRWSLRHFVDPVGTFSQIFNLLLPGTGIFSLDGFFLLHEEDTWDSYIKGGKPNHHMIQLLLDTGAPFLMQPWNDSCSLNRFILRRPDNMPCPLPMRYLDMVEHSSRTLQSNAQSATQFEWTEEDNPWDEKLPEVGTESFLCERFYGSRSLFKWFERRGLLPKNFYSSLPPEWVPISLASYGRRMSRISEEVRKKRAATLLP